MNKSDYDDLADMNSCIVCCSPNADDDGYCSEYCRLRGIAQMFHWYENKEKTLGDYIFGVINNE